MFEKAGWYSMQGPGRFYESYINSEKIGKTSFKAIRRHIDIKLVRILPLKLKELQNLVAINRICLTGDSDVGDLKLMTIF